MAESLGDASKEWRKKLQEEVVVPDLLNSMKLEKYYDIADKVALQAQAQDEANQVAHAYISYKRYFGLALEVIPRHNYFNNNLGQRREALKRQNRVLEDRLKLLVARMDEIAKTHKEEVARQEKARRKAAEERAARERQQAEEERRRAAESTAAAAAAAAAAAQLPAELEDDGGEAEDAEMEDLALGMDDAAEGVPSSEPEPSAPGVSSAGPSAPHAEPEPSAPPPYDVPSSTAPVAPVQPSAPPSTVPTAPATSTPAAPSAPATAPAVPTTPIVPAAPAVGPGPPGPSSADLASAFSTLGMATPGITVSPAVPNYPAVGRPSYMPPGPAASPVSSPSPATPPAYHEVVGKPPVARSAAQEKAEVTREWNKLLAQNQAKVEYLNTFQGRMAGTRNDSTNGCTVVSPLVGYRHITWTKTRLPTSHIDHVIDVDTPPILQQIRRKHALPNGAFIVPADVHDFLFDRGLLKNLFGDVHGGNVLDDAHLNNLLEDLEAVPRGDKAAVAFFFSEHVVPILKNGDGTYEFVDSLPHQPVGRGVRILCSSAAVLRMCMKWYAYSKLSPSKLEYINNNPWNESMAELDVRTFQAHVWFQRKK